MNFNGIEVCNENLKPELDRYREEMFSSGKFSITNNWDSYNAALDTFLSNYFNFSEMAANKSYGEVVDEKVFAEVVTRLMCGYVWARVYKKMLVGADLPINLPFNMPDGAHTEITAMADNYISKFKEEKDAVKRLTSYEYARYFRFLAARRKEQAKG